MGAGRPVMHEDEVGQEKSSWKEPVRERTPGPRMNSIAMDFGCHAPAEQVQQPQVGQLERATTTSASSSCRGVIKRVPKRNGSDIDTCCTKHFTEAFDKIQETRRAEAGPEPCNGAMMEVTTEPAPEQPLRWWHGAWSSIEREFDTQTSQMERMLGLQAERMNTLEARLEQEETWRPCTLISTSRRRSAPRMPIALRRTSIPLRVH